MKAVQILMDEALLTSLDATARHTNRDRSKLVREAVARYLADLRAKEREQQVIDAYREKPLSREEMEWLQVGEWPKD